MATFVIAFGPGGQAATVDPRAAGLEIAMGEWTLVPDARAVRPGRVIFVVVNRGRVGHGFRIRAAGGGHGGERLEARTRMLGPGQRAWLTIDLPAGVYELECFVEGVHGEHDALGMRALLSVRADAPFVPAKPTGTAASPLIAIERFAFSPGVLQVRRGATVRWVNRDAAPHTVTAASGAFSSRELERGSTFVRRFTRPGSFAYVCAIHPLMRARPPLGRIDDLLFQLAFFLLDR